MYMCTIIDIYMYHMHEHMVHISIIVHIYTDIYIAVAADRLLATSGVN